MLDGLGGILKTRAAGSCCSFILITCTFSNAKLIYLIKKQYIKISLHDLSDLSRIVYLQNELDKSVN